jgi:hypothetical protein
MKLNPRLFSPHLADEQLVAFLDGELPTPNLEMAKTHLDTCKECQIRMAFFEECSKSFLALRQTAHQDDLLQLESPISQFRERLARHAERNFSKKSSFGGSWQRLLDDGIAALSRRRKPALAIAVAIVLVVATTATLLDSTASAETILLKAEIYESQHKPDSGHLAQDILQVEEIDEKTGSGLRVGTILLIRDSASPAVYLKADFHTGQPEEITISDNHEMGSLALRALGSANVVDSSVLRYLETQHSFPDPSVTEFRKLIAGRGNLEPSTKRKGNILEVHYPFASGHSSGIREAVLFVKRNNYLPTRVSLFTGEQDAGHEYRFTRTDFSVKDRTVQLAQLFHAHETVISPVATRPRAASSVPAPLEYANSRAVDAEVAAAQALHEVSACLGEEIYVFPMSDGSVWVQGLVDKKERRDIIKEALSQLVVPVKVEIYTPEEVKSGARLFNPPDRLSDGMRGAANKPAPARVADLSSAEMAYHNELYDYYARAGKSTEEAERDVTTFSNELSRLSRWTLLNAWSIKKLDEEFSPARTTRLSSHGLESIARMREDHLQQIRNSVRRQSDMIAPLLKNSGAPTSEGPSAWNDSETLLNLAAEQNRLVGMLFATSQQATEKDSALSRLADILHRMNR